MDVRSFDAEVSVLPAKRTAIGTRVACGGSYPTSTPNPSKLLRSVSSVSRHPLRVWFAGCDAGLRFSPFAYAYLVPVETRKWTRLELNSDDA